MALNYSHRPVMTSYTGGYVEGVHEGRRSRHAYSGEVNDWNFSCGKDNVDQGHSLDLPLATSKDIYDLPNDPFDMFPKSNRNMLYLHCFLGGLDSERNSRFNFVQTNDGMNLYTASPSINSQVYNKPNVVSQSFSSNALSENKLNVVSQSQSFPSNVQSENKLNVKRTFCREEGNTGCTSTLCDFGNMSIRCCPGQQILEVEVEHDSGNMSTSCCPSQQILEAGQDSNVEGAPHEALAFALGKLGVKDLLSVERVCRSLCSIVRDDSLLWRNIHIDEPLSEISDEVLVHLTNRAQGLLHSLNLVECAKVTDDGIMRVLESNPRLNKLCVPGCTRISIEGIVNNMKMYHRNEDVLGIKYLRIGGIFGVTHEHFEELNLLLGVDRGQLEKQHKPHFYHRGNVYLPSDDDRALDIEMCPICEKFRLVYDCPAESCQDAVCRACTMCIPRCAGCGRCVSDTGYVETFSLELLCFDCDRQHR